MSIEHERTRPAMTREAWQRRYGDTRRRPHTQAAIGAFKARSQAPTN